MGVDFMDGVNRMNDGMGAPNWMDGRRGGRAEGWQVGRREPPSI